MREGTPNRLPWCARRSRKAASKTWQIRVAVEPRARWSTPQSWPVTTWRAIACLEVLPASEYRDALVELSEFAVARTH
jgi:octaprenyl-diphosphate synthase